MGLWQRIQARLGLGEDYEYDDEYYDDEEVDDYASSAGFGYRTPYESDSSAVRRVNREPDLDRARGAHLRPVPSAIDAHEAPQVKMHIVEPRSFSEAQSIADKFKTGTPVIMNLSMTDAELSKRLIDFASGLTYGRDGGLQKVSDKVFMLTPVNVDVSAEDRRRLKDKGLFTLDA